MQQQNLEALLQMPVHLQVLHLLWAVNRCLPRWRVEVDQEWLVVLGVLLFPTLVAEERMKDLEVIVDLHYKKFTDVPLTGKVTGKGEGSFKDGENDGSWVSYKKDGTVVLGINWNPL